MSEIENFDQRFLEFAKSRPADELYNPISIHNCALAQFVKSLGWDYSGSTYYGDTETLIHYKYPPISYDVAIHLDITTWGNLADALERKLELEQV